MDECFPLGSLDATTLRMLLEKERSHRSDLEQEVARPQAGVARQNEVNLGLGRREGERHSGRCDTCRRWSTG